MLRLFGRSIVILLAACNGGSGGAATSSQPVTATPGVECAAPTTCSDCLAVAGCNWTGGQCAAECLMDTDCFGPRNPSALTCPEQGTATDTTFDGANSVKAMIQLVPGERLGAVALGASCASLAATLQSEAKILHGEPTAADGMLQTAGYQVTCSQGQVVEASKNLRQTGGIEVGEVRLTQESTETDVVAALKDCKGSANRGATSYVCVGSTVVVVGGASGDIIVGVTKTTP